ncbi:MAG: sigma-70 family RNA polymerase sigma factor [Anaerolineae bacterium]|nr:sigma-70 family RNA polymerase sigma factor [Anaerolineae bacterium]
MQITPEVVGALFLVFMVAAPSESDRGVIEPEIAEYIKRAQQGDREALAILYQLHVHAIHRYVGARIGVAEDSEDVTAEVFVAMVKALPAYRPTGAPFAAWLYRIASAQVANYYRKHNRLTREEDVDRLQDPDSSPEELFQDAEKLEMVRRALNQLSEEQQIILVMRFVERKSHAEVASSLGKSVAAVKTLQHRALIALSELLGTSQKSRHYLRGSRE